VAVPVAAAGAALEAFVGLEVANNVIGAVVQQLVAAFIASDISGIQEESYRLNPSLQISVADVVEGVIKGHIPLAQAQLEASLSGVNNDRLTWLINSAGEPLPLLLATEAWRRGIIPQSSPDSNAPSLEKAIRDSRLKNIWIPTVEALQFQLPPIGVVIEGWLRAQITPEQALDYAYKQGVDKDTATLMFKAAGRPPSPQELLDLWRRGIIPEKGTGGDSLSVDQGYLETDLKDKWLEIWKRLKDYVPPPRTVTAMIREGALTDAQGLRYFQDAGLTPDLAAIYLSAAHHQRSAATKELAKADVLALFVDRLQTREESLAHLEQLGYPAQAAEFELEIAEFRQHNALLAGSLSKLRTLYIAHKLTKETANKAMTDLGVSVEAAQAQLDYWDVARQNNVAILSAASVASLVKLGWYSFLAGVALLEGLGYSNHDAQLYILEHLKLTPADALPDGVTVAGA
jgi:hypothetical protein